MTFKGKGVAGKSSAGKRKLDDDDKTGGQKRRNRHVLQFFDDVAAGGSDSDDSIFGDDFMEEELEIPAAVETDLRKTDTLPLIPKEEEFNEEEFDQMMEGRYKDGSTFGTHGVVGFENKILNGGNSLVPSAKEPIIWKVKCMVGRERNSVCCLMQKFVELRSLHTKLHILSAFSVDHVKGFIYIEAFKQNDIVEACRGICMIYASRVAMVPRNEVSHLFSVRNISSGVSAGDWVRVKNGKYKGDLAQIVAVNNVRKRATVKLIPRIDLQAMAEKPAKGAALKRTSTPAPRLISSSELEEYLPLIRCSRDKETGLFFQYLDGLMLKDGYLYKKVSIESLNCYGVVPTEEELLKFQPTERNESDNLEWLSQIYGEQKKKKVISSEKVGGKGESSSGSVAEKKFEVHDLVCFGKRDFGLIIGMEKDDSFQVLTDCPEGSKVVTVQQQELKSGPVETKFTAVDQHNKNISVNDTVKVLEGPNKDRQGIVKHIYRHTIFVNDENEVENGSYFCCKAQLCEKVKLSFDGFSGKGDDAGPSVVEDFSSSPKSPLSPKQPWQAGENNRNFNRGEGDCMFSIGQTLRIRVGPLKGYICRVIAIHRSDVTVKLDSQQKVLTVKSEHLVEVHRKTFAVSVSDDPDSNSSKPFDLLGVERCSGDWMSGTGTSAGNEGWNAGGPSTERSSWPSFPSSGKSFEPGSSSMNPVSQGDDAEAVMTEGGNPWESKGKSVGVNRENSWGIGENSGDKSKAENAESSGWNKAESASGSRSSNWGNQAGLDSWNGPKDMGNVGGLVSGWNQSTTNSGGNPDSNWSQKTSWNPGSSNAFENPDKSQAVKCDDSSNWNSGSGDANKNSSSNWGKTRDWNSGKANSTDNQNSDWGRKDNCNSGSGNAEGSQDSAWARRSTWDSGSRKDAENQSPDWGSDKKDCKSGSGNAGANGESNWGKRSSWNSGSGSTTEKQGSGWEKQSGWSSGSANVGGNEESNWSKKSSWNSGSGDTTEKQSSGWEKQSGWSSGSANAGENQDSERGKQSNWNSGSGNAGNQDSGWEKRSDFNSGSANAEGNQDSAWGSGEWISKATTGEGEDSTWGKKRDWDSGSGGSNWGDKSKWNSGDDSGGNHFKGGNAAQSDDFGDRQSGENWRGDGGRGGRGFRGRGGGGFGGRGGDRGGFHGRGRSDGGGFRGRGRSDRGGGFSGRGRGRRDQGEDWNSSSGDYKSSSWSGGANAGSWKASGGAETWTQGSNEKNEQPGWTSESGKTSFQSGGWSSGWKQSTDTGGTGVNNAAGDLDQGNSWKPAVSSGGSQWGSWNQSTAKGTDDQKSNWKAGSSSAAQGGAWNGWGSNNSNATDEGQSSGWNQSKDPKDGGNNAADWDQGNSWKSPATSSGGQWDNQSTAVMDKKGTDDQKKSNWTVGSSSASQGGAWNSSGWNNSNAADQGQSSGWNQSKDAKDVGGPSSTSSWGKGSTDSWGKGSGGGSQGGW